MKNKKNIFLFAIGLALAIAAGAFLYNKFQPRTQNAVGVNCGPKALSDLLKYYRVEISPDSIAKLAETGKKGTSMLNMAIAARYIGFESAGVKTDYAGLGNIPLPALAHINNNHYIVLVASMPDSVLLEENGKRFFESRENFIGQWAGNVLLVYPKQRFK